MECIKISRTFWRWSVRLLYTDPTKQMPFAAEIRFRTLGTVFANMENGIGGLIRMALHRPIFRCHCGGPRRVMPDLPTRASILLLQVVWDVEFLLCKVFSPIGCGPGFRLTVQTPNKVTEPRWTPGTSYSKRHQGGRFNKGCFCVCRIKRIKSCFVRLFPREMALQSIAGGSRDLQEQRWHRFRRRFDDTWRASSKFMLS